MFGIVCDSEHNLDCHILLTTYASLDKLVGLAKDVALILYDEAHHLCTNRALSIYRQFPDARAFGFTATPIVTKLINMYSCDNDLGGILTEYDFRKALDDNVVCDYRPIFSFYEELNQFSQEVNQMRAIRDLALNH